MKKQHLEGILSRTLKHLATDPEYILWYMKLQNNPLAHKTTPADFIVINYNKNILIECKETKTDIFMFDRLTQKSDLESFSTILPQNRSYVLLCFWQKNMKNSDFYMLKIDAYNWLIENSKKKSITRQEAKETLKLFKLVVYNKILDIRSQLLY